MAIRRPRKPEVLAQRAPFVFRPKEPAPLQFRHHEFRTLADIVHPNLVTLHELHTLGGEWLLTMFRQDATDRDAVNDCIKAYRAFAYVNAVNVWKQNIHFNLDR